RRSTRAPSPQLGGELLNLLARLLELIERGCIGDAEVRPLAERRALNRRDALLFEKLGDEVLIRSDHLARRRSSADRLRAGRIDIERPLRLRALQVLGLPQ